MRDLRISRNQQAKANQKLHSQNQSTHGKIIQPLSERFYVEVVSGSPTQRTSPKLSSEMVDAQQCNLKVPPSETPQEEDVEMMGIQRIEVDNTLGLVSEDVNALLQNNEFNNALKRLANRNPPKVPQKGQEDSVQMPRDEQASPLGLAYKEKDDKEASNREQNRHKQRRG